MNFRQIISDKIEREMPFLRKIRLSSTDSSEDYLSKSLLPFLFYTNTVDQKYRIIPVFLNKIEYSIQLPLFYSLALFKIYSNSYLEGLSFRDTFFNDYNAPDIICADGSICKLIAINYTSADIAVRNGKGIISHFDFESIEILKQKNKYTGYYSRLETYFNNINNYNESVRIGDNPLELIQKMQTERLVEKKKLHGALYLTTNPGLLKSNDFKGLTINDVPFFNTIPSGRVDYSMGKMSFHRLGHKGSREGKIINKINEFLIFTDINNYKAYNEIRKERGWLDTLIFDFTKDSSELDQIINYIQKEYITQLKDGKIKNIYLLFNEKDLHKYYLLQNIGYPYNPLLLNIEQKKHFSENADLKSSSLVETGTYDFNIDFNRVIAIIQRLCAQVHLINLRDKLLIPFFDIKKRYLSYYNAESLNIEFEALLDSLKDIRRNWFYSQEHEKDFTEIYDALGNLKNHLDNPKLNKVKLNTIKTNDTIGIISFNDNINDFEFLKRTLNLNKAELLNPLKLKNPISILNKYDSFLVFNANRELFNIICLNVFRSDVTIILNVYEKNYFEKINKIFIPTLSNSRKLSEILNIEFENGPSAKLSGIVEDDSEDHSEFLADVFIRNILKENSTNKIYTDYVRDKKVGQLLLFFNDNTSITVNENKYFFIYKENIESLKECHVQAKELKVGDLIFIIMHDAEEFEKLIWKVAEEYPDLKNVLELDEHWRNQIKRFVNEMALNLNGFRLLLAENGFTVQSAQAIHTWINGDVYQPRNIDNLISALFRLGVLSEYGMELITKSIKTAKKLKTRLPYELRKMHVADLNDLEYKSDLEFPELSEKMLQFLDIKTISLII